MNEITHCYNQRPIYETDSGTIVEWNDPKTVMGEKQTCNYPTYHPFVIDIETSAELGQRPILMIGYNSLSNHLFILYSYAYQGYTIDKDRVEQLCDSIEPSKITIDNLSQSNFETYILYNIAEWNKRARKRNDNNRISLVAHNAQFDIPMLGSPNDDLLLHDKIGSQYEQAVQYNNIKMLGHRAGQFGYIYTFLDSSKSFESLHIPVGDTMVAAKAMWIEPASLKSCCESLNVNITVSEAEEHGQLSNQYVQYCLNDVFATYKLHQKLQNRITNMFGYLPIERVYSTASIGKYVLKKMNYKRVGYSQEAIDRIAPAYFGGRTDAFETGEIVENLRYTDILSQYPTVSKLTNVWEFMQCKTVDIKQIEPKHLPDIGDLRKKEQWSKIANYYVKVKPDGATLPVRTPHLEDTTKVVTANVHSEKEIHYHYMDIIASQLIDGCEDYEIVAAWKVTKHGSQDLKSKEVAGVEISPQDNVMAKCIEARKNIQYDIGEKNERTKSLKITANSLYGIAAERIVKETPKLIESERADFAANNGFYNPHVAATITAAGRLQIALGQSLARDHDGRMVYCDTDSLLLTDNCAQDVIEDFNELNPYDGIAGEKEVLEDEKDQIGQLYAVGTKKYVFFTESGEILEYKEHGLGNYKNLRGGETIKRLWATILYYDLEDNPLSVNILYDKRLNERVIWSFNASTVSMRTLIDQFTDDYIRYGDWIESTLSYDDSIRYIALNLTDKDSGTVAKVKVEDSELVYAREKDVSVMREDDRLKTVRDVVFKFTQDAGSKDETPTVDVTDFRIVTKETTSRLDIFTTKLEREFRQNMKVAAKWVFD